MSAPPGNTDVNQDPPPPTPGTTRRRGPNWLPAEEAQLAISWVNASEQPEFAANQTSETFYRKVEEDFNLHSRVHYRNWEQIRTRWGPLNTSTLKFAAIYNAIERVPPSGSGPDDWLKAAHLAYQSQNKGVAFNSVPAWQNVRHVSKWQQDGGPDRFSQTFENMSETIEDQSTTDGSVTASGITSSDSQGSLPRPIGQKAAKRRRIEGYKDDEILSAASEFSALARDRLAFIGEGNIIAKEANALAKEQLKIEEKKQVIDEQHRQSEVQINDLKMLRETVDDLEDEESKNVLRMIQKKIKNKWLST
ncbi:hypothetical protein MJO28_009002 [Puccinia striiformis f. sp. tritici]|uniref:Uncharacterized protein n=1 Tax=Puccinia striiformis f. sp. tritici TaxID=168172 RepID=A0ACC0EEA4_9BASI|nr:hypothetical protein MJO28_009002 [Puccinia striiformis f. sp. tritici]